MNNLVQDIKDWLDAAHMGTQSNQLRCAAMCAADDGFNRRDFVAACKRLGINQGTAGNRWREAQQ